jgi:hypothetical protein
VEAEHGRLRRSHCIRCCSLYNHALELFWVRFGMHAWMEVNFLRLCIFQDRRLRTKVKGKKRVMADKRRGLRTISVRGSSREEAGTPLYMYHMSLISIPAGNRV